MKKSYNQNKKGGAAQQTGFGGAGGNDEGAGGNDGGTGGNDGGAPGGAPGGGGGQPTSTMSNIGHPVNTNGMKGPNIRFFSMIGPYITIGCFLLLTIINMNIKGVIYFIGIVILLFVSNIVNIILPPIKNSNGQTYDQSALALCQAFGFSIIHGSLPFGILVYSYTFIYLFIPMIQTTIMNYPLLLTLLLLLGTDMMIQLNTQCFKKSILIMGLVTGIIVSISWVFIVGAIAPDALYSLSDYVSDKQVCSMPSEQNFKCKVFKNGELISAMTT